MIPGTQQQVLQLTTNSQRGQAEQTETLEDDAHMSAADPSYVNVLWYDGEDSAIDRD